MKPIARFEVVALDTRDPQSLAAFYGSILGWDVDPDQSSDTWVQLRSPAGATLAFQAAPHHVAPTWPSDSDHLQAHLDFYVDDLDIAEELALAVGAKKSEFQPHPTSFRVYFDPTGHPFCLCKSSTHE